jgi:hypothetical protein
MDLETYLESVRRSVQNATALADDQTRSVAERLATTLDDAGKLALIAALSDAAAEISRDLSPGSVELRMAGTRPEFVVTPAPGQLTGGDEDGEDHEEPVEPELDADEATARITLRLPVSVKAKVDEAAAAEGLSANAWLMRTVLSALSGGRRRPPRPPRPPRGPRVFVPEDVFGPDGPFGAEGMLGPGGPFGPQGVFGPKARDAWKGHKGGKQGGKRVTGWAE